VQLAVLFVAICLVSCGHTPPKLKPCSIVNATTAECDNVEGYVYDKPLKKMLGWTCFSPDDIGNMKKFMRRIVEELDEQGYGTAQTIISGGSTLVRGNRAGSKQPRSDSGDVSTDHRQSRRRAMVHELRAVLSLLDRPICAGQGAPALSLRALHDGVGSCAGLAQRVQAVARVYRDLAIGQESYRWPYRYR